MTTTRQYRSGSHQATVPPAVDRYFSTTGIVPTYSHPATGETMLDTNGAPCPHIEAPTVAQVFYPDGRGWVPQRGYTKRVSASWLRKLRREGATAVALRCGARVADFTITEALSTRKAA